jgi:hypothetical protein
MADDLIEMDDFEDDQPSEEEDRIALNISIDALESRCKAAHITFERGVDEDNDPYAVLTIGDLVDSRPITVWHQDRATNILDTKFENYKFVHGYEGICDYNSGYAEISLRSSFLAPVIAFRRLSKALGEEGGPITITPPPSSIDRPTITIGSASREFRALSRNLGQSIITVSLSGVRSKKMEDLLPEIRTYCDNVMMQIDGVLGFTFLLQRSRKLADKRRIDKTLAGHGLLYPTVRYNDIAASLYWYAKSARDMPLLRFLAFYQSVEYYFPRYSTIEARKRVASIIKSPNFRLFNDDDIDRIVSSVRLSRGGGLGDERSQLRAVVGECISSEDMRSYLEYSADRREHFSGKSRKHRYHKVPLENKVADLRNDVADRIYDIRCKIVHTKSGVDGDGLPMLVPFSEEADYLSYDIDLMEFVSKAVLVSSSGDLT